MQETSFQGMVGEKICQNILAMDSSVLFASISSLSGSELAAASKASASLLICDGEKLKEKYSSLVSLVVSAFRQGEHMFGKLARVIAVFDRNLRVIMVPLFPKEICVVLVTTREFDAKTVAFQISKVVKRFS